MKKESANTPALVRLVKTVETKSWVSFMFVFDRNELRVDGFWWDVISLVKRDGFVIIVVVWVFGFWFVNDDDECML